MNRRRAEKERGDRGAGFSRTHHCDESDERENRTSDEIGVEVKVDPVRDRLEMKRVFDRGEPRFQRIAFDDREGDVVGRRVEDPARGVVVEAGHDGAGGDEGDCGEDQR